MRGWTLDPGRGARHRGAHDAKNGLAPQCVAVTPRAYITGWGDGNVRCHDNATGELLWTIPDAHAGGVTSIARRARRARTFSSPAARGAKFASGMFARGA